MAYLKRISACLGGVDLKENVVKYFIMWNDH